MLFNRGKTKRNGGNGMRNGNGPNPNCQYQDGSGSFGKKSTPKKDGSGQGMRKNRKK